MASAVALPPGFEFRPCLLVGKFLLLHQLSLALVCKDFSCPCFERLYLSNKENFNANKLYPWRSIQLIQL